MRKTFAFILALSLFLGLAACGENPVPDPDEPTTQSVTETGVPPEAGKAFNNGGRYVKYGDATYYWEYTAACLEPGGIWGEFREVPGVPRPMARLGADGKAARLFTEDGYGNIWIYKDRFYLARLDADNAPQLFSVSMDGKDKRELGPGEIFALDEARGLLIASVERLNEDTHRVETCVLDTATSARKMLPAANAALLLYDEASAALYYRDLSEEIWRNVRLCGVDVTTGEAHDIALIDTEKYDEFEDCYTVEPDAAWLESDGLHVILSGYSGNAHMFMNSVHLIIALDGSGITQYDDGDAPDYGRYPLHKPFETRDINGEDEFSGYSIRVGWDTFEPVLTPEDLSGLGLPDGPFFRDDDFADVRDVEYADGALFFTIVQGPRDPAQDIGWREGYDIASVHVYRKDVASGQINILYSFASIFD